MSVKGNSQKTNFPLIEKYIYKYDSKDDFEKNFYDSVFPKLVKELPDKTIYIFSENIHYLENTTYLKTKLFQKLESMDRVRVYASEFEFINLEINRALSRLPDIIKDTVTTRFFERAKEAGLIIKDKIESGLNHVRNQFYQNSIGKVGLYGFGLGLRNHILDYCYLLKWTSFINVKKISGIDNCLNILKEVSANLYSDVLGSFNEGRKIEEIKRLLYFLEEYYPNQLELKQCWYNLVYFTDWINNSEKYSDLIIKENYKSRMKTWILKYTLREKYMFNNFRYVLQNYSAGRGVSCDVSTYHSLGNYSLTNDFDEWFDDKNFKTFGKYIDDSIAGFKKYRICFINNDVKLKNRNLKHKNRKYKKQSLEYYLRNHKYAFIDLKGIKEDTALKNYKFFMSPVFEKYLNLSWQNYFNGVIFINKDNIFKDYENSNFVQLK